MAEAIFGVIVVWMIRIMAIPVTVFPILYWRTADWRAYREGQSVMISAVGLMLLVDLSVLNQFLHITDPTAGFVIDAAVFLLITIGSVMENIYLIKAQREANSYPSPDPESQAPNDQRR